MAVRRHGAREVRQQRPLLQAIDEFENKWFPITRASLEHRYPVIAEEFFLNLSQTSGARAALWVQIFVTRLNELESGAGVYGTDGAAARALLAERGLTEERVREVQGLLAEFDAAVAAPLEHGAATAALSGDDSQVIEAEERALWNWYLEWSTIARVAIRDRRHLRALGFLKYGRGESAEDAAAVPEPSDGPTPPCDTAFRLARPGVAHAS